MTYVYAWYKHVCKNSKKYLQPSVRHAVTVHKFSNMSQKLGLSKIWSWINFPLNFCPRNVRKTPRITWTGKKHQAKCPCAPKFVFCNRLSTHHNPIESTIWKYSSSRPELIKFFQDFSWHIFWSPALGQRCPSRGQMWHPSAQKHTHKGSATGSVTPNRTHTQEGSAALYHRSVFRR